MLIVNAGVMRMNKFINQPVDHMTNMIDANMYQPAILTALCMPQLIKRDYRSALIVVSSVGGHQPLAINSVYAATKAFVKYLFVSLGHDV
jgi:short-subunit dehydrogenase